MARTRSLRRTSGAIAVLASLSLITACTGNTAE